MGCFVAGGRVVQTGRTDQNVETALDGTSRTSAVRSFLFEKLFILFSFFVSLDITTRAQPTRSRSERFLWPIPRLQCSIFSVFHLLNKSRFLFQITSTDKTSFEILTGKRNFFLRGNSKAEADSWIEALLAAARLEREKKEKEIFG